MPRNSISLTLPIVEKAAPRPTPYLLWDSKVPGLGLRVGPNGAKAYYARYRIGGGRSAASTKMKIGDVRTTTLADARNTAREIIVLAAKGEDPTTARSELRNGATVRDLVDLYCAEGLRRQRGQRKGEHMAPKTQAYTMSRLRNHVLPVLGGRKLSQVTAADVVLLHDKVRAGATAAKGTATRGGAGAARKVVRDLSAVFTFAVSKKLLDTNPVSGAQVNRIDNQRKDYLTEGQMTCLGEALNRAEREHGVPRVATDQIRLWLLTGMRRDEGSALRWDEVMFEHARLELRASKSLKARPLTPAALGFLLELRSVASAEATFVFPSTRGDSWYTGVKRYLPLIKRLAGIDKLYPHLLRHTFGSHLISGGLSIPLAGVLLGHANMRSTLVYAHVQQDKAARAAGPSVAEIAAALKTFPRD